VGRFCLRFCSGDSPAFRMTSLPLSSCSKCGVSKKGVGAAEIKIQHGTVSGSFAARFVRYFSEISLFVSHVNREI
jgi:hypothetical protein